MMRTNSLPLSHAWKQVAFGFESLHPKSWLQRNVGHCWYNGLGSNFGQQCIDCKSLQLSKIAGPDFACKYHKLVNTLADGLACCHAGQGAGSLKHA